MTITHPDLRYALSIISQYCANSDSTYVTGVVQISRDMYGILYYSFTYTKDELGFIGYINADWSGAIDR